VEQLASFYRDVLCLPEVARHLHQDGSVRSIWLDLGVGAVLMIEGASEAAQAAQASVVPGLCLLALRISAAERGAWEARLQAAGAVVEARTAATSYARDPEGNRVAVSFYALPVD
jgi:catechol-2,3-dioxygenase